MKHACFVAFSFNLAAIVLKKYRSLFSEKRSILDVLSAPPLIVNRWSTPLTVTKCYILLSIRLLFEFGHCFYFKWKKNSVQIITSCFFCMTMIWQAQKTQRVHKNPIREARKPEHFSANLVSRVQNWRKVPGTFS